MEKKTPQEQLEMIARGDYFEIMDYVSMPKEFIFCDEAEIALINRGDHDEIMKYVSYPRCLCEDAELALVARGDYDELMTYMAGGYAFVQNKVQVALVHLGNHDVIMKCVPSLRLCQDAELALIARGNHQEIMAYGFEYMPASQLALVERGDHSEIMACISHARFSSEKAQIALIKRGNREEVRAYAAKYRFSEKVASLCAASLKRLLASEERAA